MIGHAGHPEEIGTLGQLPDGDVKLVENVAQAEQIEIDDPDRLSFVTQTTLSVDDTADIVSVLKRRFPNIDAPRTEDICYATTNRQAAVKVLVRDCDAFIVLGAPNSSNSSRLAEVAAAEGCTKSIRIERAAELNMSWMAGVSTLGVTAGASAPEILVKELLDLFEVHYDVTVREVSVTKEDMHFSLPRALSA